MTQIRCLDYHKTAEKWPELHKYEQLPQYFAPILWAMEIIVHMTFDILYMHIGANTPFLVTQIECLGELKRLGKLL